MAVIGKIRRQSGLLIILIGLSLVLFLLSDFLSGGRGFMDDSNPAIGTIAGDEILQQDFELRVQKIIDDQYGQDGATEQVRTSLRETVWQQLVSEKINEVQYNKLGISVSPAELMDQVKNSKPGTLLYQYFTDRNTGQIYEQFQDPATGGLNSQQVLKYVQNVLASENASSWLLMEDAIKKDVAARKYVTMLSKGLVVSASEVETTFAERAKKVKFRYALKEFASLKDEDVAITDVDFTAYYTTHKHEPEFQSKEESRDLKMIVISVAPSEGDILSIKQDMEQIKTLFAADTNDSVFVGEYSDSPVNTMIAFADAKTLNPEVKDTLLNAPVGAVVGPYNQGTSVMISKVSRIDMSPDSVMASHILMKTEGLDSAAKVAARLKLDSIKSVVEKEKNFAALAEKHSEDVGSAVKGGDLDWFQRGMMVPPFEKACFDGKPGDLVIVESQFGWHLISVTKQTAPKKRILLASVDRLLEPSKSTSDKAYKEASKLSADFNTLEKFTAVGEPYKLLEAPGLTLATSNVPEVGEAKEIVRWAFDAEVGAVSVPFELENKFVVVALALAKAKGTLPLEAVKEMIRPDVLNEKKAAMFISEFGSYTTLDQAAANAKTQAVIVEGVGFADGALPGGIGREPKLVGTAFALEKAKVSKPITGNRGVFVIEILEVTEEKSEFVMADEKRMMNETLGSRVDMQVSEALKKVFVVEDNRAKYY